MRKILIGLMLMVSCFCFASHAWIGSAPTYEAGTIADVQTLNTAAVKVNIYGSTKEAMLVVPYTKTSIPTIETASVTSTQETLYTVPAGATRVQFQARVANNILYAFSSGAITAGSYFTLKADSVWWQDQLFVRDLLIYLKGLSTEADVVEIETWR